MNKGKTIPEKSSHQNSLHTFYISVFTNFHEKATCSYVHLSSRKSRFYSEIKKIYMILKKVYKRLSARWILSYSDKWVLEQSVVFFRRFLTWNIEYTCSSTILTLNESSWTEGSNELSWLNCNCRWLCCKLFTCSSLIQRWSSNEGYLNWKWFENN